MTRRFIPARLVVIALLLQAADAQGQQRVRGTLVEAGSGVSIHGAMVVALADGEPVARTLTAADGSFLLDLPAPGIHELRVDRIGYASTLSGPLEVAPGEVVEWRIEVAVRPVSLRGLRVVGDRRCRRMEGGGQEVATVWEEARKALEAARWTSDRELYRFSWIRYVRELDAGGSHILREERERRTHYTTRPFKAVHPDSLAAHGFVREQEGHNVYAGPDAGVLLSESFLRHHCFGLDRKTEDGRRFIGLRFEPHPSRSLPDIQGVMWLDEESGQLASIEYEYVNLGRRAAVQGKDASGQVTLRGLPNGTWIVEDWSIRMPSLAEVRSRSGRPVRYEVVGYVEEGGTVARIATSAGVLQDRDRTGVRGTVTDSLGRPAPGVRVRVDGTDREVMTGPDGTFELEDLAAGIWRLIASHPFLARHGHPGTPAEVELLRGRVRELRLRLPSLASWVRERCRAGGAEEGEAGLIGSVIDSAGRAVPDAAVRIVWTLSSGGVKGYGTASDSLGIFTACGLPAGSVSAVAFSSDGERGDAVATLERDSVAPLELQLRAGSRSARRLSPGDRSAHGSDGAWLESTGFWLREGRALLHTTGKEMVALDYDSISAVLADVPRLEMVLDEKRGREVWLHPEDDRRRTARGEGGCRLDLYLNGSLARHRMSGTRAFSFDHLVEPARVTGLEVYDGAGAPVGARDSCGAVLLWVEGLRHPRDPVFAGRVRGRMGVMGVSDSVGVAPVEVRLEPGGQTVRLDAEGRFELRSLPPAIYRLEATVPGWGPWNAEVEVRAYVTTEVVVDSLPSASSRESLGTPGRPTLSAVDPARATARSRPAGSGSSAENARPGMRSHPPA